MDYMYKCSHCNALFREPDTKDIWLEDYYGVAGDFNSRTYKTVSCCPYCDCTDIEEVDVDELILEVIHNQIEEANIDVYDWLEANWEDNYD